MEVAPAAPDRHCREIDGETVVAHGGCLRVNLPSAVEIVCGQVEEFAGERAEACRNKILAARGFAATVSALKLALAVTYRQGAGPHGVRQRRIRETAQKLERLLLSDFTSDL